MFGKSTVTFFLLGISACAKPNYSSQERISETRQLKSDSGVFAVLGKKVSFVWEKLPTDSESGSFYFRTFSTDVRDEFPLLEDFPQSLSVVLWMPGMGHGSAPVSVERLEVGTYRASKVFFTMHGNWQIRFQLKEGSTVHDEALLPYTF